MSTDGQTTCRPAKWQNLARSHPVRAYFVITYLLSWCYWLVIYGLIDRDGELWAAPGAFAPALAAVLITGALEGTAGVRSFVGSWIRWRAGARWYVFSLVVLLALVLLGYVFLPDGTKGLDQGAVGVVLTYLGTFVVILFVGGGQEEPGWRGFALRRLQQRLGPVAGSVVVGALWGVWHLPVWSREGLGNGRSRNLHGPRDGRASA